MITQKGILTGVSTHSIGNICLCCICETGRGKQGMKIQSTEKTGQEIKKTRNYFIICPAFVHRIAFGRNTSYPRHCKQMPCKRAQRALAGLVWWRDTFCRMSGLGLLHDFFNQEAVSIFSKRPPTFPNCITPAHLWFELLHLLIWTDALNWH